MSIPNDAPAPRLCHVLKWDDFDGYGFNLHTDKSRPGQYIGKVDEKSPAEAAGLMQEDRIVEVNEVNVANENHKQVVQRIKAISDETRLLVVDSDTDSYYKSRNIVVKGTQSNIKYMKSPETSSASGPVLVEGSDDEQKSHTSDKTDSTIPQKSPSPPESPESSRASSSSPVSNNSTALQNGSSTTSTPALATTRTPASAPTSMNGSAGLNLNMTAAEMKAMLAQRKKKDPKKDNMDLRMKYKIVQSM